MPDRSGKIRKTASTDYGKLAKALGEIISSGIKIGLVDINKSSYTFKPDIENNQILFGMKALLNISDESVKDIIDNRPYSSPKDFYFKVKPKKQTMISLIKSGAFDNMMDRKECMIWYIWTTCDKKKTLNLRNVATLMKNNLLPEETEEEIKTRRIYEFNRYLKEICLTADKKYFKLDERANDFIREFEYTDLIVVDENSMYIEPKKWDKIYQKWMDLYRKYISENESILLNKLNEIAFLSDWNKYAHKDTQFLLSAWEMESMCFYYNEHELSNINTNLYNIKDFNKLSTSPKVSTWLKRGNKQIPIFELSKICGTCIDKNKRKSTVTLLTTSGVVNVKFRKEYFSVYDKQISERQSDGTKKIMEKSFFNRGNMIMVSGFRQGDDFIVKKYANSTFEQLYKIESVYENGEMVLRHERYQDSEV